ncbi:Acetyl-coenzyme A synthetase [Sinobacterium norvegicum]|uniref:Acetyl-coenzyme A synthetase n=1 Tax=Sinobacterium norvegicum TaxID=1641715 RepID=A0ABM9AAV1_9GAMM|nr:acetate--CoA ligase [Sinobacterium norvegicum]CAH0990302.1 Acetyl-coenzyme A synthetase [Sinobacterium norvegicum]
MTEPSSYPVMDVYRQREATDLSHYQQQYDESINNSDAFWRQKAQRIEWTKPFTEVENSSFDRDNLHIRWFEDGELNITSNCIDRHLDKHGDNTAFIFEPNNPDDSNRVISYKELYRHVCQMANALKSRGVKKGDVVTLYMPMIPEAIFAMLACARIGAPHSVVFGGFSPEALADRIDNGQSKVVITADEGRRGSKTIPLKDNVDVAIQHCHSTRVDTVIVVANTGAEITWVDGRDVDYTEITDEQAVDCEPVSVNAEDPLFILYTSGSTGKPKGVVHTTGGYSVYNSLAFEEIFDYHRGETYWCTADIGWITGHSYVVYGPLLNGATSVIYEGMPNWPTANRAATIVDKYNVDILYTAPTAIRAMMADGDKSIENCSLSSLRLLGTVGEPINPEAWRWLHSEVGKNNCPIVDTWWQTETGGIMLTPLPGATALKPGSATLPFFGIQPEVLDADGTVLNGPCSGGLCIAKSWPAQARTIFGDHQRFIDTYFSSYDGYYFTSDGCNRDEDGYYWITGRVDDVLNVAGHRMGTAEIESALVAHHAVTEAAVVGKPHAIKGEAIYVYVSLNSDTEASPALEKELKNWVRQEIGAIASPDTIQFANGLPKTRSGKIMRRILRKIASDECDQLGDTSTLADPTVVDQLIEQRQMIKVA